MIWIILVGRLDAKTMVMYDNILANHPDGLASVIFERLVTQSNGVWSLEKRYERKSITLKCSAADPAQESGTKLEVTCYSGL